MKALFRHGDMAYATESLITMETPSQDCQHYPTDIQGLLGKNERVFNPLQVVRSHNRGFDHVIDLEKETKPMITTLYRHPKRFKDEIEKPIKELLDMGHIIPSSSPFTLSSLIVKKKYGTMRMWITYMELNKKIIKN
jgi:hypothetical protein